MRHATQDMPIEIHTGSDGAVQVGKAERDVITIGVATAAIILFIGTGGTVLPTVVRAAIYGEGTPDRLLANALLLNIALIIFGWRRYKELREEIGVRECAEREARRLSETDPLTDCLNRRSMTTRSEDLRKRARDHERAVAFIMVDVDNFKQINDINGHLVGDEVLVQLANRIRTTLPQDALLARLGGDEFAIAASFDPAFPERVDDLVIRLYEAMATPIDTENGAIEVRMSIGIASDHTGEGFNPLLAESHALMRFADIAMYHSKKHGKNRFFWFEPSMENELRFRNELEEGIRRGLKERHFVPYYEQQVDVETGRIVGFEMLARWRSPQLGIVSPEIFIPIAEEIGVISELSDQLIASAFADALEWDDTITLSINISPVQLRDPWFAQKLLKQLVKGNFPPHRLDIEITESCLHDNISVVRSMITSLRNQGVRISLDDFGTGYSSLEQLRTLPFDRIKIDRSFIAELANAENGSRIVDAIVSLGRGLDLPITAEGIEDEQILRALQKIGDLKGQGFLYGRPEPAEEVRTRLAKLGLLNPEARPLEERAALEIKAAKKAERLNPHNYLKRVRG